MTDKIAYQGLIREMPENVRPREKLCALGAQRLTDAELLAIILGSGNKTMDALQMAEYLLRHFQGLRQLYEAGIEELVEMTCGIGKAKATSVKAALELGKRLGSNGTQPVMLRSPEDVKNLLMDEMGFLETEHVRILCMDQKSNLLGMEEISVGGLSFSMVHPREVFRAALRRNCRAIILVHNHPSGNPAPSAEDIASTERIVQAGELLGITVADHIIMGDGKYYSLKAWGYL